MIHFFGILEPLTGKRQRADEAPRKIAFFGHDVEERNTDDLDDTERADIEDAARERQNFLLQSFSPQF